jgi:YjbE family integral membrane protein
MLDANLLSQLAALAQVLMIDLVLAGDNAVVVGLAVAGLPPALRRKAILFGIGAATVIRIGLALVTLQLLAIIGLVLAGGLLLLWVCWRMYRELRTPPHAGAHSVAAEKTLRGAMLQIALADVSMSLDNVLAVAGAAREHPAVLVIGLSVSVVLMGAAASLVARMLARWRWLAWVGLLIVVGVAVRMIWEGSMEVAGSL